MFGIAFLYALEFPNIQTLEMDIAISKDGQVVLSHEPWFSHEITTTPEGDSINELEERKYSLYAMPRAEIQKYDVGQRVHPRFLSQKKQVAFKPSLQEVVKTVEQHPRGKQINYNIEIKSAPEYDGVFTPPVQQFAEMTVKELARLGIEERTTIQSFDPRALQAVREISPKQALVLLVENEDGFEVNISKLGFTPAVYSPYFKLVDTDLVSKCHAKQMKLIPWTVNDSSEVKRLIELGVDGIITDYPALSNQK